MKELEIGWDARGYGRGQVAYVLKVDGQMLGEVQPVLEGRRQAEPSGWVWMTYRHEDFGTIAQHTGDNAGVYASLEAAQMACRTYVEGCLVQRGLLPAAMVIEENTEESDGGEGSVLADDANESSSGSGDNDEHGGGDGVEADEVGGAAAAVDGEPVDSSVDSGTLSMAGPADGDDGADES